MWINEHKYASVPLFVAEKCVFLLPDGPSSWEKVTDFVVAFLWLFFQIQLSFLSKALDWLNTFVYLRAVQVQQVKSVSSLYFTTQYSSTTERLKWQMGITIAEMTCHVCTFDLVKVTLQQISLLCFQCGNVLSNCSMASYKLIIN